MQPPTLTAAAAVTTPRHPMQKPPTPPSSTDTHRSITPTSASAEPTPPPARSSSSSSSSHPVKPMNNGSPTPSPLESQRVKALLDINQVLLQEVMGPHHSRRAGNLAQAASPPQPKAKTDGNGAGAAATLQRLPMAGKMSVTRDHIEFVSPRANGIIHPPPPLFRLLTFSLTSWTT